jgi:hypothetical protein
MLGFKQQAMLKMFRERKRLGSTSFRHIYNNMDMVVASLETLELKGFIRKVPVACGIWEYIEGSEK